MPPEAIVEVAVCRIAQSDAEVKGRPGMEALIVWTTASSTWVVYSMTGEYAGRLAFPNPPVSPKKSGWAGDSLSVICVSLMEK